MRLVESGSTYLKDCIAFDADAIQKQIVGRIEYDELVIEKLERDKEAMLEAACEVYDLAERVIEKREALENEFHEGYIASRVLRDAIFYKL